MRKQLLIAAVVGAALGAALPAAAEPTAFVIE